MKRESILAILAALGCAGTLAATFWGISVNNSLQTALSELDTANQTIETTKIQHTEAMQYVQEQAAQSLQDAQGRWSSEKTDMEARHSERISAANAQFTQLMENGEQSLSYINTLEGKLRNGKKLTESELERLGAIAQGLDQLRVRYEQPLQEFTELGVFFEKRANQNIQAPEAPRFKRVRRLFDKDYREQEKAYQQQVGQKEAFAEANASFTKAYKAAQTRIQASAKDMAAHSQRIYALISEKELNKEDLEQFFTQSRSAIRSHLDIIELDTDLDPTPPRND
jgi:hypothetical protein